ncbi:MAG TPA: DUF3108 domain-containing protein [Terriglobales bacterium]|nr:DUF3108 domain-containing protein [Terriglobales bacterium]
MIPRLSQFARALPRLFLCCLCVSIWAAHLPASANDQGSIATIGPSVQILAPPPTYHFPDGQAFVYTAEWHLFTAGTSTVKVEPVGNERRVSAIADSAGMANVLYGVHDRFEALFDSKTFCSNSVFKHIEEGSHRRETKVNYDYPKRKSVLHETNLKTNEIKYAENDIPPCVTDVVTGFYYLSSLPLQMGNSYTFPVNDGGKTAEVTAHVEGKEKVKVPAGTYETVRVAAEATSGNLKGRGKIWTWFTDDANHTPVQMRAKLTWGTLLFRLQRIERQ